MDETRPPARVPVVIRLRPSSLEELDRAADSVGLSRSELARRFIADGLTLLTARQASSRRT